MVPLPPQINQQEDPMEILRRAQEALRAEEEQKAQFMAAAQAQAQRQQMAAMQQQALQRAQGEVKAPEQDPNKFLKMLEARISESYNENNPLVRRAKMSPEELEKEMRTAAEPKNKWVRRLSMPFAMMGGYDPNQYRGKAAEEFLKTQEQYRKGLATDYTVLKDAAKITSTDTNADAQRKLKAQALTAQNALGTAKVINDIFKTDLASKMNAATIEHLTNMDETARNKYLLEVKKQAENIPESELMGRAAAMMQQGKTADAEIFLAAGIEAANLKRAVKANPGSTSTSTRQGETLVVGPDGKAVFAPTQSSTTTTRPPQPGADYLEGRMGLSEKLGVKPPVNSIGQPVVAPPTGPRAQRVTGAASPGIGQPVAQSVPGGFRSAGNVFKSGSDKKDADTDTAAFAATSDLFANVMDATANGVVDRVHGPRNNFVAEFARVGSALREAIFGQNAKSDAYDNAQIDLKKLMKTYENDPKAQMYFNVFNQTNVTALRNFMKKMTGLQSVGEEAHQLASIFPKLSDPPQQIVSGMMELMLRASLLEAMTRRGFTKKDVQDTSMVRNELLNQRKFEILDNLNKAKLRSAGGVNYKDLLPGPRELDMDSLLDKAIEESSKAGFQLSPEAQMAQSRKSAPPSAKDSLMIKGGRPDLVESDDPREVLKRWMRDRAKKNPRK